MFAVDPHRFGTGTPAAATVRAFDGTQHMSARPHVLAPVLDGASVVTVMARVKLSGTGTRTILWAGLNSAAVTALEFRVESAGTVRAAGRSQSADSYQSVTGATSIDDGAWHTVFAEFNIASDTINVYLDATAASDVASPSVTFGATTFTRSTTGASADDEIGRNGASAGNYFSGSLCDVAIFRRTLSSSERSALHGGDRPDQVTPGPALYWPLDSETDLAGRFGHARAGGIDMATTGAGTSTSRPTIDAHSDYTENRFSPIVRAMRTRGSFATSVGLGNPISAVHMRGAGVNATQGTGANQPLYQQDGSSRDLIRFDGSNDYLEADIGEVDLARGVTIVAIANVSSGFRILSLSNGTTSEQPDSVFLSPAAGLGIAANNTFATATYTDYTVGSSGTALFAGRFSGNAITNWLNGVKRNGTVSGGTELDDGSFIPTTIAFTGLTTQKLQIGRRLHSSSSGIAGMDLYDCIVVQGALTDEEVQYLEGILAHENSLTSLLPVGHPWKSTQPDLASAIAYPWGSGMISRATYPATVFVGAPGIARHEAKLYACHEDFNASGSLTGGYLFVSNDDGANWRGLVQLDDYYWGTIWRHTDGNLYLISMDRRLGDIVIRKSTDDGASWSSTTLSSATGPVAAAGSGTTAPNYHRGGGLPPLYYDGHLFLAFENYNPVQFASGFKSFVLYCDATADLMDETQWSATSQLTIGATGFSNRTEPSDGSDPGFSEGSIVLDGSTLYNVLRFGGSSTPDKAVFLELGWDGATLTNDTWDSALIKDLPGGNVKFQMAKSGSTYYAVTNDNTAEADAINSGYDQDQRNHVTLLTGTSLSTPDFAVSQTLINKATIITDTGLSEAQSIQYHGFQYPAFVLDGSTMHIAYRLGWSGSKDRHDSNFIGYGSASL